MSTVVKAISLLEALGSSREEAALAGLARIVGFDKATTRRLLMSLIECGLVEQNEHTRLYRLGAGVARLALMREAQFPFLRSAIPIVARLSEETGETAHLTEYSSRGLISVHVVESDKANRVSLGTGEMLPLHATASGIAFLAFAEERIRNGVLNGPFSAFTPFTVTDPASLTELIDAARARGYSLGAQGFEEGVFSVAAPILGTDGFALGALAIAAPRVRIRQGDIERYGAAVASGAREIGERLFGSSAVSTSRAS